MVMGTLKSRLRARFPRRHSGVPSVASSKSNASNGNGIVSNSRPVSVSECAATGHAAHGDGTGCNICEGSETPQATASDKPSAAPHATGSEARDSQLRHPGTKQETAPAEDVTQASTADVTRAPASSAQASEKFELDDEDDDNNNHSSSRSHDAPSTATLHPQPANKNNLQQVAPAAPAAATPVAAPSDAASANNMASAWLGPTQTGTFTMHSADHNPALGFGFASGAFARPSSAAAATSGDDQRVSSIAASTANHNHKASHISSLDASSIARRNREAAADARPVSAITTDTTITATTATSSSSVAPSPSPLPNCLAQTATPSTSANSNADKAISDAHSSQRRTTLNDPPPPSTSRPGSLRTSLSLRDPARQPSLQLQAPTIQQQQQLAMGGTRKIWVRRPGSSATTIQISEADLVDDVRDMILRKYANSLGRQFDSPDLTLSITPRESHRPERVLGPEEPMARTLDAYFPGGQTVEDALIVDIPVRRTPRPSPRTGPPHAQHLTSVLHEEVRPAEAATDYFGPGAESGASDQIPASAMSHDAGLMTNGNTHPATNGAINGAHAPTHPHAISVLSTGQVPQIPSPGGTRTRQYRDRPDRPRLGRQHTSSPTIIGNAIHGTHSIAGVSVPPIQTQATHQQTHAHAPESSRAESHSNATDINTTSSAAGGHQNPPPPAPPLPTPPVPESDATMTQASQNQAQAQAQQAVATPPARVASPRPSAAASKQLKKKKAADNASLSSVMLGGGVPPINVLIVEDNIINLRLLEAFVKRLKVRWSTAMDGREAVAKWRTGGFHLVLMDIQLPIMSGLEATREIRRLERLNSIGAFSMAEDGQSGAAKAETSEEDKLKNREAFKSPVIIVALTASSLQSDRHEALAAGCNDFLTKPVTYVWLERKVMEWGCMQALIDFDGWRKWKLFSQNKPESADEAAAAARKAKAKKNRLSVTAPPSEVQQ